MTTEVTTVQWEINHQHKERDMKEIKDKVKELYKKKPNMFKFAAVVAVMLVAGYFFGD